MTAAARPEFAVPPDFAAVLREQGESEARVLSDADEIRYATAIAAERIANRPIPPAADAFGVPFTDGVVVEAVTRLWFARDKGHGGLGVIAAGARGVITIDTAIKRATIAFDGYSPAYLCDVKDLRARVKVVDLGGAAA